MKTDVILENLPAYTIEQKFISDRSGSGMRFLADIANYGKFGPYWTFKELIKAINEKTKHLYE